ncbi:hypothetical protein ABZ319_29165 [Nocardia sp. NPDC005978]|uniref:hypothetical protein n=1 Tax=Nocardia sp. NPDC005978 TaxID=3156725 RepID=UPI0033B0C412
MSSPVLLLVPILVVPAFGVGVWLGIRSTLAEPPPAPRRPDIASIHRSPSARPWPDRAPPRPHGSWWHQTRAR